MNKNGPWLKLGNFFMDKNPFLQLCVFFFRIKPMVFFRIPEAFFQPGFSHGESEGSINLEVGDPMMAVRGGKGAPTYKWMFLRK